MHYVTTSKFEDMCYAEYFVHTKYFVCALATAYLGCEAAYADSLLL
jgi:hypothetical protein